MRKGILAALAGAAALACAGQASAEIIDIHITGQVLGVPWNNTNPIDKAGVFSAAGTDLTGAAFDLSYHFDTSIGTYNYQGVSGSYANSPGSAVLTIAGTTLDISGYVSGIGVGLQTVDGQLNSTLTPFALALTNIYQVELDFSQPFGTLPTYLNVNYDGDPCVVEATCRGSFQSWIGGERGDQMGLQADHLTITTTGPLVNVPFVNPVPEPSTWALMLLGFFGLGGALRSRRRLGLA